ncbi:galactose-1-epimerase [Flavobacteriaceae bacterium Ap0902]|nr:galactose-1-epimerase [Flavobacteriaceae bacterium Ap0902]
MKDYNSEVFGSYNNQVIKKVTLRNDRGFQLSVINFGAIIQSIKMPEDFDKKELVLGFNDFESYISEPYRENYPYLGAVIGRHAGRIRNGETQILGKTLTLNTNQGANHLHGGNIGFDSKVWDILDITKASITLGLNSPDGEENYPGNLQVEVTYALSESNEISITYTAETEKPTLVNLTQHTYFNLNRKNQSVLEDQIKVNSNQCLALDDEVMPTGEILSTKNSAFDFSDFKNIPAEIDHSFIIKSNDQVAATLRNEDHSIQMDVYTDQPIVHIYSGYYVPTFDLKDRISTGQNAGVCFETQGFLDANNHSNFPSNTLKPEEEYIRHTKFSFKF